jgi:hypothetical protein
MVYTRSKRPIFKQCTCCGFQWRSRDAFLWDQTAVIVGYQARFKELETGIFLFNHSCGTTLAIQAGVFKDMYNGPIFQERATGTDDCPGYCLNKNTLKPCPAKCECAYVREIIQLIKTYPNG